MAKKKSKKNIWFVRLRGSYIPCSWQGWLLYIPFIGMLALSVAISVWQDLSLADSLFDIVTRFIVITVAMHWIAARFAK